ncbi:Hypothetical protein F387_01045 [Wohlfahrtiimonas chitiniclastica SH04]|uniref:HD Cas3-type domain-containing protein n=1 Tax=Wohlfahrtiimonas chitiniclastica SH04 TaxID=1261130 RepID=L8XYN8_9GAMM|nr:CRISPR-associated endonuclease Cas3'' [Wohlfahrtiimonas chitiniclastica]ELV09153.1 Hypothetical protein F387_01045 [Wohlfahrtiimonas chitiniclastica SH04]
MIVTFISQCEKKALSRTRRVLDAYANRIGDNVWQTIITDDGLLMVKKLLRKTASKNTAVSCHWIRSRRRSELLWIVGNRSRFNEMGYVPVNWTMKDLITDVMTMKAKENELYANTQLQPLAEHLFAVGWVAEEIFKRTVKNEEYQKLSQIAFLAGCLHDVGKLDPYFQEWVRKGKQKNLEDDGQHIDVKFTFDKHPRHNEISAILLAIFDSELQGLNLRQKEALIHVIYWHHAKPFRKTDDFEEVFKAYEYLRKNLDSSAFQKLMNGTKALLKAIQSIATQYQSKESLITRQDWSVDALADLFEQFEYHYKGKTFAEFKSYSLTDDFEQLRNNIQKNAHNNLLRACVTSADRLISQQTAENLLSLIAEGRLDALIENVTEDEISLLIPHLESASSKFPMSERTQVQNKMAEELSQKRDIPVLAGPAGCGKTRIALEWARLQNASQIIWVCPRVQVCQGIFQELIETYLPDADVEIFTGEFKYTKEWGNETPEEAYFSGDVIVTTIDQILGSIVTHTRVDSLIPFMQAHVVFDEFHEYIPMDIFNILFAELIANKNMHENYQKKALLVSATPHYFYLKEILGIHPEDVVEMASFNPSQYQLQFVEYDEKSLDNNPFFQSYENNTFVISNTALTAQLGFIYQKDQENSILFHSKYKKSDKRILFDEVYNSFKKDGTHKYAVLRSGPIVQASLNISADTMLTEMTSPENMLQRLGRLDRFGQNKDPNILTIAVTEAVKNGKSLGTSAYFLNQLNRLQTTKYWYDFLQEKIGDRTFSLTELYQIYKDFYHSELGARATQGDLEKAIKQSITLIGKKVAEPSVVVKNKAKDQKARISKNSLRGDSRFVQLALLDLDDYQHPIFMNAYAYEPPLDDRSEYDNLTESLTAVRDLLPFIAQKQGIIDPSHPMKGIPAKKMKLREQVLEGHARDPDYPLYLSYHIDDLDKVGGVGQRNEHAIYYAICSQQAIGMIAYDKLQLLNHNPSEGENHE